MRNSGLRRRATSLAIVATIALVFSSLSVTAIMQNAMDPAARKLPTQKPGTVQRIPLQLAPAPNLPAIGCDTLLVDGGFETGGIPNTFWNPETSTNFGTSLCDVPSCGTGGGASPPRTGAFWNWFGGIPAAETATLGQTVNLGVAGSTVKLNFFMRTGTVSSPFTDVVNVRVDGAIVASFPEPTTAEAAYTLRSINISAFANGASHAILFEYIGPTTGTGSYVIDDVEVISCGPTAADGTVSGRITDSDGAAIAGAVVELTGTQNRKFITDANGNYQFDDVETNGFYTVRPSRKNFAFSPAERSFSQVANNTEAAFTGSPMADSGNAIDTAEYFVRQHYLDFLGREPDEGGFNFWSDQMIGCGGDSECLDRRRINVSAAYFLSIEFQETGGLVDGLYRASYGRRPLYAEFMPDARTIGDGVVVGEPDWEGHLATNKEAFLQAFVQRAAFRDAFDSLSNGSYVDTLISHTGASFTESERDALVNGLAGNTLTRAAVLQSIAEDGRFADAKRNETFVMMEYFGYLGRDPDSGGFDFWLNKLNQFNGNFEQAEMVKAFINSGEYRARFD